MFKVNVKVVLQQIGINRLWTVMYLFQQKYICLSFMVILYSSKQVGDDEINK